MMYTFISVQSVFLPVLRCTNTIGARESCALHRWCITTSSSSSNVMNALFDAKAVEGIFEHSRRGARERERGREGGGTEREGREHSQN